MTIPPEEDFGLVDSLDAQILMHRDAHFGGKFEFMLDYYEKEGKGINPEFELDRIRGLAEAEKQMGQNLAATMLNGSDAEKVAKARSAYKSFHDLYDSKGPKKKLPLLIADLILSEEETPEKEIEAVAAEKGAIVPLLIDLLRSGDFADSLFPGYGQAPALAIECLKRIGDKRAIISLFEAIGEGDFFNEDLILDALKAIGEPAKVFLLKVLSGKPFNYDNERAAIALERFKDDQDVCKICLKMLGEKDVQKDPLLSSYLAIVCEGLTSAEDRQTFLNLAQDQQISKSLQRDITAIAKTWKSKD